MKKKTVNVILTIILLIVVVFAVYYFIPKNSTTDDPMAAVFKFEVMKEMEDWEIQKYSETFNNAVTFTQSNPDQMDGWMTLGAVQKQIGNYKAAETAWLYVNEIRPLNSTSFGNLADLYANFLKEYDKAEPMYRRAIENSMNEDKNRLFYRNFFYFCKDYLNDETKAESILLEGIEKNPKSDLLALAGSYYQEKGDNDKAIEYYRKYLEVNPESESVQRELNALTK